MKNAIAGGHKDTVGVAKLILESGGNAFDATVAAFLAMSVTEPAMASAGAGGFLNVFTQKENFVIDFFCQTPRDNTQLDYKFDELTVDFGATTETFFAGPASIAVSGAMAMVMHLIENYCTIPLKELIQPAQTLAKDGVRLTAFQAFDLALLAPIFGHSKEGRDLFFKNNGIKKEGDCLIMPNYPTFLDSLANESSDWYYRGEIAQMIAKHSKENGGFVSYEDFVHYTLHKTEAFMFQFGGFKISVPGLPSMGGGLLALFLSKLKGQKFSVFSSQHFNILIDTFKFCAPYVSNSQALQNAVNQVYGQYLPNVVDANILSKGTSHLNVSDKYGNAVSLSTSLGEGSGYFVPGTDIQMNNMLGETALLPNGLNSWIPNARLNSMMTPTLVFDSNEQLVLALGSGGATRIPFSIAQVLFNRLELNMSIRNAIEAPRVYSGEHGIYVEHGFDYTKEKHQKEIKKWASNDMLFGGTHTIDIEHGIALGDDRREGIGWIEN